MAKIDWNYFEYSPPPEGEDAFYGVTKTGNPDRVSPGGGEISLQCVHSGWAGASPRPMFGYMYNGPDIGEFPIQDMSMSIAIRTQTQYAECVGMIVRSQTNLNGTISDPNDLNFYMVGVRLDSTYANNQGSVAILKIVNGNPFIIGGTNYVNVVDYATDFIQIEYKFYNSDVDEVSIRGRRNTGSQLTYPGDPGWGTYDFDIDYSPGVLINPGYCGFGVLWRSSSTYSGDYNFDRIQITQEIIW